MESSREKAVSRLYVRGTPEPGSSTLQAVLHPFRSTMVRARTQRADGHGFATSKAFVATRVLEPLSRRESRLDPSCGRAEFEATSPHWVQEEPTTRSAGGSISRYLEISHRLKTANLPESPVAGIPIAIWHPDGV